MKSILGVIGIAFALLATTPLPSYAQGCWTEANCRAKCRQLVAAGKSRFASVSACYSGMPCSQYPKKCK